VLKNDAVKISGLEDVEFDSASSMAVPAVKQEDFCVFSSSGNYRLTASTAVAAGGLFQMTNGNDKLDYQIALTAIGIGVPAVLAPMTSGIPVTGLPGDSISDTCITAGTNATITVTIQAEDFNAAAPGQYADTLTMLVEPE